MARVVIHTRFDQPSRENPWTELVGAEPAAHPYHDWYDRLTAECYRPFAFARILVDGAAVASIVNLFERCSFDLAPNLGAWLAHAHPALHDRIVTADRTHRRAIARAWSSSSLAALDARDRRTEIAWGLADFQHRFGRPAESFFLTSSDLHPPVLADVAAAGIGLVLTDATVPDDSSALRRHDAEPGLRIVYAHQSVTGHLAQGFRSATVTDVADTLAATASGASVAVVVVDGHVFGHHVAYSERSLAVLSSQLLPRLGLTPSALPDAALDAVTQPAPPAGVAQPEPWRRKLADAINGIARFTDRVTTDEAADHLTDPWATRETYGQVASGALGVNGLWELHGTPNDPTWVLGLLECHRHLIAARAGLEWGTDLVADATLTALRHLGRAVDGLIELGVSPPILGMLETLGEITCEDDDSITGRTMWEQHVLGWRVDGLRTAAHLALIRHLRGGAPTRVGLYDVKGDRHARSRRGDLQLDTGRVRCTHRRTGHSVELAYAILGDTDFEVSGALRPASTVLDDDTDAVALHKALAGPSAREALRVELVERFGPLEFGFDALIPEAAPRVLGDIAQGALGGLIHRAIATGTPTDASAVMRFIRLVRSAGVRLDIAPAQESLYLALLHGEPSAALTQLGADLGLAVGRLRLPD